MPTHGGRGVIYFRTISIWALLCAAAIAQQLVVTHRLATEIVGLDAAEKIGPAWFVVAEDADITTRPVILVTAETAAANLSFDASDQYRVPVDVHEITPTTIMITAPGRTWVTIWCVDFDAKIFATKTVVVDLAAPDPPGPDPDPEPDPPGPGPDPAGPFDGLAYRVWTASREISASNRSSIANLLNDTAAKMRRFEFKIIADAKAHIQRNWPMDEKSWALYKLLGDDASRRAPMSWQDSQMYYREVARGVAQ